MTPIPMTKLSHSRLWRTDRYPSQQQVRDTGKPYLGHSASSPSVAVKMRRAGSHQAWRMKSQKAPGEKGLYITICHLKWDVETQVLNSCPYKAGQCQKVWKNQRIFMGKEEWKGNTECTLHRELSRESFYTRRHLYFQDACPHSPPVSNLTNLYFQPFSVLSRAAPLILSIPPQDSESQSQ